MGKSYTKVQDFVVSIESGIKRAIESEESVSKVAYEIAEPILREVTNGRKLKYNDWSGNLRRSYVVRITSRKQYYLFKSGLGVSARPIVVESDLHYSAIRNAYYFRLRRKGHPTKSGYTVGKGKKRKFVGFVYHKRISRWHPFGYEDENSKEMEMSYKNRKEGLVRQMRPIEKEIHSNPRERHQYVSNVPQGRSRKTMSILIGNYTPYRRAVEAHGYQVIDPKARRRYSKLIQEKAVGIWDKEVNKVCASINRGQLRDVKTGRFIKG